MIFLYRVLNRFQRAIEIKDCIPFSETESIWIISILKQTFWQRKNPHRKLIYGNVFRWFLEQYRFLLMSPRFGSIEYQLFFLPNGLNHRLGRLECNAITAKVVGSGRCVPTANLLYFSIFFFRRFLLNSCCYRSIHRHALHQNLFPLSKNSQTVRSSFLSLDILFSLVLFRIVVNSNVRNNSR